MLFLSKNHAERKLNSNAMCKSNTFERSLSLKNRNHVLDNMLEVRYIKNNISQIKYLKAILHKKILFITKMLLDKTYSVRSYFSRKFCCMIQPNFCWMNNEPTKIRFAQQNFQYRFNGNFCGTFFFLSVKKIRLNISGNLMYRQIPIYTV